MRIFIENFDKPIPKEPDCKMCANACFCSYAMKFEDVKRYFGIVSCKQFKAERAIERFETNDVSIIKRFWELIKQIQKEQKIEN